EVRLRDRLRAQPPARLARDPDARAARPASGGTMTARPKPAPADPHAFGELDAYLMREGTHPRLHDKLGAHLVPGGTQFAVWAPSALAVSVIGDFNHWTPGAHPLRELSGTGVWSGVVRGVARGALYKYHVRSRLRGHQAAKADPFAIRNEPPPATASIVWTTEHAWRDAAWMASRAARSRPDAP